MKKIFAILIFLFFIIILPVFAQEDSSYGGIGDTMRYTNSVENAFAGQKPVTDEEFKKALEEVKARKGKRKKEKVFKGKNFNDESSNIPLDEAAEKNILLGVPLCLINDDGAEIPMGHYKITGKKNGNKVYLDFYQSSTLIAHVPAIETQNDFDQTAMNFVKLLPYNSQQVKVIFGSLDFNAYTFIRIKGEISDTN